MDNLTNISDICPDISDICSDTEFSVLCMTVINNTNVRKVLINPTIQPKSIPSFVWNKLDTSGKIIIVPMNSLLKYDIKLNPDFNMYKLSCCLYVSDGINKFIHIYLHEKNTIYTPYQSPISQWVILTKTS